jgi:hypothetical protein
MERGIDNWNRKNNNTKGNGGAYYTSPPLSKSNSALNLLDSYLGNTNSSLHKSEDDMGYPSNEVDTEVGKSWYWTAPMLSSSQNNIPINSALISPQGLAVSRDDLSWNEGMIIIFQNNCVNLFYFQISNEEFQRVLELPESSEDERLLKVTNHEYISLFLNSQVHQIGRT